MAMPQMAASIAPDVRAHNGTRGAEVPTLSENRSAEVPTQQPQTDRKRERQKESKREREKERKTERPKDREELL